MQTREIDILSAKDRNAFIQFPFKLYKDCSQWVPPFISDMQLVMNKQKHPFYQHSDAAFFITENGNEVLGRIAVLSNVKLLQTSRHKNSIFLLF